MDNNIERLETLASEPGYAFLESNEHLGNQLCYVTLAGSKAYGTDNENSDTDIRGFVIERFPEIIGIKTFEQVEDCETDTVIYALRKFISLCVNCNPNVIEILGTREQDVIYANDIGRLIRNHASLFLSKKAYRSFAGYAAAQLRRIQNAMAHDSYSEADKELHIKKSLEAMMLSLESQYELAGGAIAFDIKEEDSHSELYTSVHVDGMPLRRFLAVNNAMTNMLRNYDKLNNRNKKKDAAHLQKHAMHLIRLFLTGKDILEGRGIHTYREKERPMLLAIRNGEIPLNEVFRMAEEGEEQLKQAYQESELPDSPDMDAILELETDIYSRYLKGEANGRI
jgi:predicted nucleotidyltransferase